MINKLKKYIAVILELGKIRITSFVALSTLVGYILYSEKLSWQMILPTLGVFVLSCGSSALNHYQERSTDALMDRTKGRPIPSGRISANNAFLISLIMILSSLLIIYFSSNIAALILSLIALIWYNFIYTPLKKKFAMAVVPGSVIGAIPPMIGYVYAGGSPFDIQILSLSLFFFIWQIPHFWLLLLIFNKDYERAGFPTLTKIFSDSQLSRITFMWVAALAVSCLLIIAFNVSHNFYSMIALIFLSIWLIIETRHILTRYIEKFILREAFIRINLFVLAVIIIISIDKLLLKEI